MVQNDCGFRGIYLPWAARRLHDEYTYQAVNTLATRTRAARAKVDELPE